VYFVYVFFSSDTKDEQKNYNYQKWLGGGQNGNGQPKSMWKWKLKWNCCNSIA